MSEKEKLTRELIKTYREVLKKQKEIIRSQNLTIKGLSVQVLSGVNLPKSVKNYFFFTEGKD